MATKTRIRQEQVSGSASYGDAETLGAVLNSVPTMIIPSTLDVDMDRLRTLIKDIKGSANWYTAAPTDVDLGQLTTHINASGAHGVNGIVLKSGIISDTDSTDDLGASGTAFRNLYVDAIDLNGQGMLDVGGVGAASAVGIDLDADNDTSIRCSADDVIKIEIGGADKLTATAALFGPETDAGMDLGSSSVGWNDLHLGSGGVINLDGGDVTLTHSANTLTVAGGTLVTAALTATTVDATTDFTVDGLVLTADTITNDSALTVVSTDLTLDASVDITLDAGGGDIRFKDDGTTQIHFDMAGTGGAVIMKPGVNGDRMVFQQFDGTEVLGVEDNGDLSVTGGVGSSGVTIDAAGNLAAAGRIFTDDTTPATSITDGSLQTDGGLSVALDAVIGGGDLILLADSSVVHFGAGKDVTLTHTNDVGLHLNAAMRLGFRDQGGEYIYSVLDGTLGVVAATEIDLTAPTVDINGLVDISGNLTVGGHLVVQGTQTAINSDSVHVKDKTVRLGIPGGMTMAGEATYALTSNVVTVINSSHGLTNGQFVYISDPAAPALIPEGVYEITSVADVNTFTFAYSRANVSAGTAINHSADDVTAATADGTGIFVPLGAAGVVGAAIEWDTSNGWQILGGDLDVGASKNLSFAGTSILADSGGTMTLSNIDALDATTEATIESAIDTLGNLTSAAALVTVSALNAGSITSGFGTINNGASNITTTGIVNAGEIIVDDVSINGKVMIMEGSLADTASFTVGANGTLDITTVDDAAAAANITITADGTFEAIGTTITLDSGGHIALEPAGGSHIKLDDVIQVDSGVVTGATSITSTAFVGGLTGDATGLTGTPNVVLGTITGTTIDASTDFTIGASVLTSNSLVMTPSAGDTATIAAAANGILNITTVDAGGSAADINFVSDGQMTYRANDAAGHRFDINGTTQLSIIDGMIQPVQDNDIDLGSAGKSFKDAHIQGTATVGIMTATTSNLGTLGANVDHANYNSTNVDIDSGAIDGTAIGANSAAAGTFAAIVGTSLDLNGNLDVSTQATEVTLKASQGGALKFKEGSNEYLVIDTLGAGTVHIKKDNAQLVVGAGNDLVMMHDGTNCNIESRTGHLLLSASNASSKVVFGDAYSGNAGMANGGIQLAASSAEYTSFISNYGSAVSIVAALNTAVGAGSRAKKSYPVTGSHAAAKELKLATAGLSHDQGQDPAKLDVYVNGQLLTSGTSDVNGDYKAHGIAANELHFFFQLEAGDQITTVTL